VAATVEVGAPSTPQAGLGRASLNSIAAPKATCGVKPVAAFVPDKTCMPCPHQVIEQRSQPGIDAVSAKEELEATLGLELAHPHIVRTLKFATRQRSGGVSRAFVFTVV
jgi:hypothetical protein